MSEGMSLADLAGVDMGQVDAVRFENLPAGAYVFKVNEAVITTVGAEEKPVVRFSMEVVECVALNEDQRDPESLVGRKYQEMIFLKEDTLLADLGRVRAMLQDMGFKNEGPLGGRPMDGKTGLLDEIAEAEHVFPARVKIRKDPRDSTREFANLQFEKHKAEAA